MNDARFDFSAWKLPRTGCQNSKDQYAIHDPLNNSTAEITITEDQSTNYW